ncbi:serine/threonine protein kinase [Lichenifustis flavocetrariae]|uniref:Protein kinase n=1 Tax=Lichenifustis flavocetrariae TaxID=2949735 RepID=A0AA41YYW4_9HYPH|nr:protein kinase [Lichenifustis flavocetrariae]MCW6509628.1 protein kinase [Lichenifustis flavocetrariae]
MAPGFTFGPNTPDAVRLTVERLGDTYLIEEENREGGNGFVFMARNRVLGTQVVIKFYNWEGDHRYHLEPQVLTGFASTNVLKVLDAGVVDQSWSYYVSPFCAERSLQKLDRPVGVLKAHSIVSDILTGLTYLHGSHYLHRDLKPGNIYLHDGRAVIGDFGSLVRLPDGQSEVPASRHSLLFRPPESVQSDRYGKPGDIYQVGMILFFLMGGHLPTEEAAWLTAKELGEYQAKSYPDNTIFADDCIKGRIARGKVLDLTTVCPWTPNMFTRAIRRACRLNPADRFVTAADFLAELSTARSSLADWTSVDGMATLNGRSTSYRIGAEGPPYAVQKRRPPADWRNDNTCMETADIRKLMREIEGRS